MGSYDGSIGGNDHFEDTDSHDIDDSHDSDDEKGHDSFDEKGHDGHDEKDHDRSDSFDEKDHDGSDSDDEKDNDRHYRMIVMFHRAYQIPLPPLILQFHLLSIYIYKK